MTQEEMDCEESLMMDESQILEKDEIDNQNTHLVRLHHVNFFEYTPKPINCMAFDPLSKKMAIAKFDSDSAYVEIWNTSNNWYCEQTLASYPSIEAMVWHKSRLFSAGLTGDLVEFDLRSGKVKASIPCNFGPIWCLAVNKKEELIAAGTENGSIVFFEVLETEVKYRNVISRQGQILSICWHEDLNLVVTGGVDVTVWDVKNAKMIQNISTKINKETKIWAVAVTEDFTIITGDSSGHTTFCFGKPGHLSHRKRFLSHGADIHNISINPKGDRVCVAGVDGMVTFTSSMESTHEIEGQLSQLDYKIWVHGEKATHHISDVKAVEFIDSETVVTAGLDCQTIVYSLNKKKIRKISYVQQKGLVHSARKAKCLLLQYPRCLELWNVGGSSCNGERRGDILDVDQDEEKLLKINSKSTILSSCVSMNAKVIVFSNESGTSAYWIKMSEVEGRNSQIEATVAVCPPELNKVVSSHLEISPNCNILASISRLNKLMFTDLRANMKKGVISKHKLSVDSCIQDLKFNPKSSQFAVACANHGVKIVDVKSGELMYTLPKRESPVYSIDFHPLFGDKLLMSHMDATIAEMSVSSSSYTKKSLIWTSLWHQTFTQHLSKNKVGTKFKVMYDLGSSSSSHKEDKKTQADKLICQHDSGLTVVDWSLDLSKAPLKRKRGQEEQPMKNKVLRFKHTKILFHVDMFDENNIIMVEKNATDLMLTCAPTFKKHKYGT